MADDVLALGIPHGPDCPCARCRGFPQGHKLSLKHGGRSKRGASLREEAAAKAELIRQQSPMPLESFSIAVEQAGIAWARVEQAVFYMEKLDQMLADEEITQAVFANDFRNAESALARAQRSVFQWLQALGMTPKAMAELQRDLGIARNQDARAHETLGNLRRHLEANYGLTLPTEPARRGELAAGE